MTGRESEIAGPPHHGTHSFEKSTSTASCLIWSGPRRWPCNRSLPRACLHVLGKGLALSRRLHRSPIHPIGSELRQMRVLTTVYPRFRQGAVSGITRSSSTPHLTSISDLARTLPTTRMAKIASAAISERRRVAGAAREGEEGSCLPGEEGGLGRRGRAAGAPSGVCLKLSSASTATPTIPGVQRASTACPCWASAVLWALVLGVAYRPSMILAARPVRELVSERALSRVSSAGYFRCRRHPRTLDENRNDRADTLRASGPCRSGSHRLAMLDRCRPQCSSITGGPMNRSRPR